MHLAYFLPVVNGILCGDTCAIAKVFSFARNPRPGDHRISRERQSAKPQVGHQDIMSNYNRSVNCMGSNAVLLPLWIPQSASASR